jgi:hypothetical protein
VAVVARAVIPVPAVLVKRLHLQQRLPPVLAERGVAVAVKVVVAVLAC